MVVYIEWLLVCATYIPIKQDTTRSINNSYMEGKKLYSRRGSIGQCWFSSKVLRRISFELYKHNEVCNDCRAQLMKRMKTSKAIFMYVTNSLSHWRHCDGTYQATHSRKCCTVVGEEVRHVIFCRWCSQRLADLLHRYYFLPRQVWQLIPSQKPYNPFHLSRSNLSDASSAENNEDRIVERAKQNPFWPYINCFAGGGS